MPRRPLELQSLKWPFVGLAVLLAFSSLWAVYDEVVPRRPWKNFQREFFQLEEAHLKADRERAQKRLEAPETKQQLEAARAELKIEAIEKPIREIDKRLEAFSGLGKLPQMEQYWIEGLKNSWGAPTVDRCQNCHVGINKGGYSAPWEVLEAKKANLPEADMKAQFAVDPEMADAYQKIHEAVCQDVPRPPDAVPIGGYQPPAEPSPMDPAQATECRPRAAWEKWMEVGEAYCGSNARWFAKTKTVLKDAKGAVLVEQKPEWKGISRNPALEAMEGEEKPVEERVAQACSDKETVAALEEAVKTDPFDVKPV